MSLLGSILLISFVVEIACSFETLNVNDRTFIKSGYPLPAGDIEAGCNNYGATTAYVVDNVEFTALRETLKDSVDSTWISVFYDGDRKERSSYRWVSETIWSDFWWGNEPNESGFDGCIDLCIQMNRARQDLLYPVSRHLLMDTCCNLDKYFLCVDIDECQGSHHCPLNSYCENAIGSYRCMCDLGYDWDNSVCQDVDECQDSSSNACPPHSQCQNTEGSYICECYLGYQPVSSFCQDIDECHDTLPSGCPADSQCENSEGSYNCFCPAGYYIIENSCQVLTSSTPLYTRDTDTAVIVAATPSYTNTVMELSVLTTAMSYPLEIQRTTSLVATESGKFVTLPHKESRTTTSTGLTNSATTIPLVYSQSDTLRVTSPAYSDSKSSSAPVYGGLNVSVTPMYDNSNSSSSFVNGGPSIIYPTSSYDPPYVAPSATIFGEPSVSATSLHDEPKTFPSSVLHEPITVLTTVYDQQNISPTPMHDFSDFSPRPDYYVSNTTAPFTTSASNIKSTAVKDVNTATKMADSPSRSFPFESYTGTTMSTDGNTVTKVDYVNTTVGRSTSECSVGSPMKSGVCSASNKTARALCACNCQYKGPFYNISASFLARIRSQINVDLVLNSKELSKHIRTLTSAEDNRKSTVSLGSSAVIIFLCILLMIVLSDMIWIWDFCHRRYLKTVKSELQSDEKIWN